MCWAGGGGLGVGGSGGKGAEGIGPVVGIREEEVWAELFVSRARGDL